VKRVTDIIAEIAAASHEQTSGIDQVNRAVTQMDQVTQANAGQTEELSSTAQALATQAGQLQTLVARFKLDEGIPGTRRQAVPAAPAPRPAVVRATNRPAATMTRPRTTDHGVVATRVPGGSGSARVRDDGFEEF
jgi:hypothetical protein